MLRIIAMQGGGWPTPRPPSRAPHVHTWAPLSVVSAVARNTVALRLCVASQAVSHLEGLDGELAPGGSGVLHIGIVGVRGAVSAEEPVADVTDARENGCEWLALGIAHAVDEPHMNRDVGVSR